MNLWIAEPTLEADETVRWQSLANRSLNRWITSGGHLMLTNKRLLFQPHRLDSATGKAPWESPLTAVTGFEEVDRDPFVLAGGMRKRLGLKTSDGLEIFAVNDLGKKMDELREIFSRTSG